LFHKQPVSVEIVLFSFSNIALIVIAFVMIISGVSCDECASQDDDRQLIHASHEGHSNCIQAILLDALVLAEDDDQNDVNTDASVALMVNKANKYGQTALSHASFEGHSDCLQLLIEADGVDINKADNWGHTPLWWAALYGHSDCARLLREAGGV
jgi:ankyrin repeat protein